MQPDRVLLLLAREVSARHGKPSYSSSLFNATFKNRTKESATVSKAADCRCAVCTAYSPPAPEPNSFTIT